MTSPLAKRFFDSNIQPPQNQQEYSIKNLVKRNLSSQRPSAHSVRNKALAKQSPFPEIINNESDVDLFGLNEVSFLASPRIPDRDILFIGNQKGASNLNQQSKVSLGASSAQYTNNQGMTRSPTQSSIFTKDCRQLQHWLNGREIQLLTQMEGNPNADEMKDLNAQLEQTYFSVFQQLQSKIAGKNTQADQLLQQAIQGMRSCFQKQQIELDKIVANCLKQRDDAVKAMNLAQSKYNDYIKNQSVEAYFLRQQYLVDRNDTTLTEKQKHRLLVKKVQEFLDNPLLDEKVMSQKNEIPQAEPSGAESALLQLQLISQSFEPPSLTRRPEAEEGFEKQKKVIFNSVLRDLQKEAENQRRYMERHIRAQMSQAVPTAEACVGTETYETIHMLIIEDFKMQQTMKAKKVQDDEIKKRTDVFNKQIRELEIQIGVKAKIIKEQRLSMVKMDIKQQIGVIKQIIEDYFRRYLVKDLEKMAELQNMVEDVILTDEERDKKQQIREQKKKDLETQKEMLAEQERVQKKAEKQALKDKEAAKALKKKIKAQTRKAEEEAAQKFELPSSPIGIRDKEATRRVEQFSQDSDKLLRQVTKSNEDFKKSLERMASSKNTSSVESVKKYIVTENSFIHPVHESKESLVKEFVNLGTLGNAIADIASSRDSREKVSVKRSQIEVDQETNEDKEIPAQIDDPSSRNQSLNSTKHDKQALEVPAFKVLRISTNRRIQDSSKSLLHVDEHPRLRQGSSQSKRNASRQVRLKYDHGKDWVHPNHRDHHDESRHSHMNKSSDKMSASKVLIEHDNTETATTMIEQIKNISNLTAVLNSYSGLQSLKHDIEVLDAIFSNLMIMPAQLETIQLIFKNNDQKEELAQRSSELRDEAKKLTLELQMLEIKQIQQQLRNIQEVSNITDKAEQFIKNYEFNPEAMPDQEVIAMLKEVQLAQATYARDRDKFLPTRDALANVDQVEERVCELKEKVEDLLKTKFRIMQETTVAEIKSGDKIDQALKSVAKAREELTQCLIQTGSNLEPEVLAGKDLIDALQEQGRASQIRSTKLIAKMDEAVAWMEQIKEKGQDFVDKIEQERQIEKQRAKLAKELEKQETLDKAVREARASGYKQALRQQQEKQKQQPLDIKKPKTKQENSKSPPKTRQQSTQNVQDVIRKKTTPITNQPSSKQITQTESSLSQPPTQQYQVTVHSMNSTNLPLEKEPEILIQEHNSKQTTSQKSSQREEEIYDMLARENQNDTPSKQGEMPIQDEQSLAERVETVRTNTGKNMDSAVQRQQVYKKTGQESSAIRLVQKTQELSNRDLEDIADHQAQSLKTFEHLALNNSFQVKEEKSNRKSKHKKGNLKLSPEKQDSTNIVKKDRTQQKFEKSYAQLGNTGGFNSTGQAESLMELPQILQHKIQDDQSNPPVKLDEAPIVYINKKLQPKEDQKSPKRKTTKPKNQMRMEKTDILRSSAPETDYRKTGSEFMPPQNQMRNYQLGQTDVQTNEVYIMANMRTIQASDKNLTSPTIQINEDLNEMTSMMKSIGSGSDQEDIIDQDQENSNQPLKNPNYKMRPAIDSPQIIRISPKIQENQWQEQEYMIQKRMPQGSVLMLPQATQTENRSFIKYLLNLINESITNSLEKQIISKEQYLQTLEKFKNAIPEVYNAVKDSADSFFLKDYQIPYRPIYEQIETVNVQPQMQQYGHVQSHQQLHFVNSRVNLSPSYSQGNIQFQNSVPVIETYQQASQVRLPNMKQSPSQSPQRSDNGSTGKKKPVQFLQLSDFSRYGMHTLDIKKEIQQRITVKQLGMVGGGFAGRPAK